MHFHFGRDQWLFHVPNSVSRKCTCLCSYLQLSLHIVCKVCGDCGDGVRTLSALCTHAHRVHGVCTLCLRIVCIVCTHHVCARCARIMSTHHVLGEHTSCACCVHDMPISCAVSAHYVMACLYIVHTRVHTQFLRETCFSMLKAH